MASSKTAIVEGLEHQEDKIKKIYFEIMKIFVLMLLMDDIVDPSKLLSCSNEKIER